MTGLLSPGDKDGDGDDGPGCDHMLLLVVHHLRGDRHPQVWHQTQHLHQVLVLVIGQGAEQGPSVLLLHLRQLLQTLDVAPSAVEVLQHVLLYVGQLQQWALFFPQCLEWTDYLLLPKLLSVSGRHNLCCFCDNVGNCFSSIMIS